MRIFFITMLSLIVSVAFAQSDSTRSSFKISFYADLYYCYDFGNPGNHERPSYIYSFKRHNEIALNIGFINAAYSAKNVRSNFGLMTGTYSQYNLSSEQSLLRNLWQANVGLKLSRTKNIWLDGGVFSSHIGFESAISKDCWNLTRSILADNSPYYESGVKISFTTDNRKWYFSGLLLNGWQRIARLNGNNTPAFGTQITFSPGDKVTLNYSTFIGNDKPDSVARWRYYNNFYMVLHPTEKFGVTIGYDYCLEQKDKYSSRYFILYSPVAIFRYQCSNKLAVALRGEYYNDENGILIATGIDKGLQTVGYSLDLNYVISDNIVWRIEARGFRDMNNIFTNGTKATNQNYCVTTSFAMAF